MFQVILPVPYGLPSYIIIELAMVRLMALTLGLVDYLTCSALHSQPLKGIGGKWGKDEGDTRKLRTMSSISK